MSTIVKETNKLVRKLTKECDRVMQNIEEMIEEWTKKAITVPLCEYLGMNDQQYSRYVYNPFNFLSSEKGIEWMSKFSFTKAGKVFTEEYTLEEPEVLELASEN